MGTRLTEHDRFGALRPAVDAHSLGVGIVLDALASCRIPVETPSPEIRSALERLEDPGQARRLVEWIRGRGVSALGYSFRLDPAEGLRLFATLVSVLRSSGLYGGAGQVRSLWFAGLPETCALVKERFPFVDGLFMGDESPSETLDAFGLRTASLAELASAELRYDDDRIAFGRSIVTKGEYKSVDPVDRSGYQGFGVRGDTLAGRISHGRLHGLPPLMRAHVGPWLPDRKEAVGLFEDWTRRLAKGGMLDVLSIGTSQLSQEAFGGDWAGRNDGGGVPIHDELEFERIWRAARPMLVRSYAGTKDVVGMAKMLERSIDIAWHAMSLWWFSALDGRGPNGVRRNLEEHLKALEFVAASGKPFEPNVPHHFAFRGADDLSYVVSGLLSALAAKRAGVRRLVLQLMLNTPKYTWGIKDLAKARALLSLVRELEDDTFTVFLQPRGGLDYFSRDEEKAKAQLAAVTAMMDDIEPLESRSPDIIHVVSYTEANRLADPPAVDDSIRIVRKALSEYRELKRRGQVEDMSVSEPVKARTEELVADARATMEAIRSCVDRPLEASGLYEILAAGFLPVPWLAERRDEFPEAVRWNTRLVDGAVRIVDERGRPTPTAERLAELVEGAKRRKAEKGAGDGRS